MKKKVLVLFTCLTILLSSLSISAEALSKDNDNNIKLESYSLQDALNNAEIRKYLQDNGYSDKVAEFINQSSKSEPEYKINSELNSNPTLSKDVKAKLSEKYNLVEPKEKPVKTIVLVETKGDSNNTTLKANAIGNV